MPPGRMNMAMNTHSSKYRLIIYIALTVVTLAVYGQVSGFDFVNFDDPLYILENHHIQSGFTLDSIRWAFGTKHNDLWNPLVWLSFMFDYKLFGLNAGGYHVTNLILHILSSLLLFWLFHRRTGAIWKSAFVAAFFALHPLHVESVAWVSERKDTLSAFFWMLTLCLYVRYTEKPAVKRYLFVLFSFACALMSKPMAVTLPVVMILLDYWQLNRIEQPLKNNNYTGGTIMRQLKEKTPFFILSAIAVIVALYNPDVTAGKLIPIGDRAANALVTFVIYLEKTFLPYHMAVYYPFPSRIPVWQVIGAALLIALISVSVMVMVKRLPYLFVGWFWYVITIAPVIGMIQVSVSAPYAMADRYHYLPSIGLAVILAWGIPALIQREDIQKRILIPAGIIVIAVLAVLAWIQCGYWKNSTALWNHALKVTKDNYIAYGNSGVVLTEQGKYEEALKYFNEAIRIKPDYDILFINRGAVYAELGRYQQAFDDFNKALLLKSHNVNFYKIRGSVFYKLGRYENAVQDFTRAIYLGPDRFDLYYLRGNAFFEIGRYQQALSDYNRAIGIYPQSTDTLNRRGTIHLKYSRYEQALHDFDRVIDLNPGYYKAYNNRANVYARTGRYPLAMEDLNSALRLEPKYVSARYNRAILLAGTGEFQKAVEDFSQVIKDKPDDVGSYNGRASVYLNTGQIEAGCMDARKACSLGDCGLLESAGKKGVCR
jgi:tetratricopeptide (TPR) repeat protein